MHHTVAIKNQVIYVVLAKHETLAAFLIQIHNSTRNHDPIGAESHGYYIQKSMQNRTCWEVKHIECKPGSIDLL